MSTPTIPLDVLVLALQALDGAFHTVSTQPLPATVRLDVAAAYGRLEVFVQAILASQKVEVTQ